MSNLQHILKLVIVAFICLLPAQLMAQNSGVSIPSRNVMEDLFQNPEPWSGKRYTEHHRFADRFYVNTSVGVESSWRYDEIEFDSYVGSMYHLGLGYRFSPVHAIEIGSSYNNLRDLRNFFGVDLSYVFDVTAFAYRREDPVKWQFLLKSGVGVNMLQQDKVAFAFNNAMRLQYNFSPALGLYFEPMVSYSATPSALQMSHNRGGVYTSASIGLSFNIGGLSDFYRDRQKRFEDDNYITVPFFAIKTNLLFDMLSLLNIEIEVPIRNQWSVAADYTFPWWVFDNGESSSKRNRIELLNANIEGRYWFGDRTEYDALTGWFAGIYGGGGIYDLERNGEGYQGEFFIAMGVSAGYAHNITNRGNLRMEYSIGIGYMKTDYRKYNAIYVNDEWHALRMHSGVYSWFGPTKAKVSLSWLWNRSVKRKEGVR